MYKLKLKCGNYSWQCELHKFDNQENFDVYNEISNKKYETIPIDVSYESQYKFYLITDEDINITKGEFIINEEDPVPIYFEKKHNDDKTVFYDIKDISKNIFRTFYGEIYFRITIERNTYRLYSDLILIQTSIDFCKRYISPMYNYLFKNPEYLPPAKRTDDRYGERNNFYGKLQKIKKYKEILQEFQKQLKYFRANTRYILKENKIVDSSEKLRKITSNTISFILTNPNYLTKSSTNKGIKYGGEYYVPSKTLISEIGKDFSIYENQIILSFLQFVCLNIKKNIEETNIRIQTVQDRLNDIEPSENREIPYKSIHIKRMKDFKEDRKTLLNLFIGFESVYNEYFSIMQCKVQHISDIEELNIHPTQIFTTFAYYYSIYQAILEYKTYKLEEIFKSDEQIYEMYRGDKLYENYLYCKLCKYFSLNIKQSKIKNDCREFENSNGLITRLYFQENIYCRNNARNYLGLYRNNLLSISGKSDYSRGDYYKPDYIVEIITKKGELKYYILDAKFSEWRTLTKYTFPEIAYKYVIGISPLRENIKLEKVIVLYGRATEYYEDEPVKINNKILEDDIPDFISIPIFPSEEDDSNTTEIEDFRLFSEFCNF